MKLVDFGIATAGGGSGEGLVGKVSYMSPEQVRTEQLDCRSDIFSLGIVMYELLVGKQLFRRADDTATLVAVLQDPIPSLAPYGIPSYVERAMLKALARARDQRWETARAFEQALLECIQQVGSTFGSHQMALYMKTLFGEQAARPPTTSGAQGRSDDGSEDSGLKEISETGKSKSYQIDVVSFDEVPEEGTTIDPPVPPAVASEVTRDVRAVVVAPAPPPPRPAEPPAIQAVARATVPAPATPRSPPAKRSLVWRILVVVAAVGIAVAAGLIYTTLTS